jgi:hypothetical protein
MSELEGLVVTVNGLVVGAGQTVRITEIRGLDELPDIRTFDQPRSQADGLDFGTDLLGGRVIEVDTVAYPADVAATAAALRSALVPDASGTLQIDGIPGLPSLLLDGRVRKRRLPTTRELASGVIRCPFDFETDDARLYAATETVLTTGPGSTSGSGFAPPLTPPLTPGGSAVGGNVQALNEGNRQTWPVVRVDGPVTAFSLTNSTTGKSLRFTLPLVAGEHVVFDMDAKTVLLGGTASRRQYMTGSWWDLPPGLSDVFYLPADAAVGSSMTLRFRSAYV